MDQVGAVDVLAAPGERAHLEPPLHHVVAGEAAHVHQCTLPGQLLALVRGGLAATLAPAILFSGSQNPEADDGAGVVADGDGMLPFCRGVVSFSSRLTMLLIEADDMAALHEKL